MLVLSRKLGQKFKVGEDIKITIVKIDRQSVRIGVEAPTELGILREELKIPADWFGGSIHDRPRPK
jgi:carbon storage regulator